MKLNAKKTLLFTYSHYCLPMNLWEGNIVSRVCLFCLAEGMGVPTIPYRVPSPGSLPVHDRAPAPPLCTGVQFHTPGHVQTCSTWTLLYRDPTPTPNIMKHVLSASGRLAFN